MLKTDLIAILETEIIKHVDVMSIDKGREFDINVSGEKVYPNVFIECETSSLDLGSVQDTHTIALYFTDIHSEGDYPEALTKQGEQQTIMEDVIEWLDEHVDSLSVDRDTLTAISLEEFNSDVLAGWRLDIGFLVNPSENRCNVKGKFPDPPPDWVNEYSFLFDGVNEKAIDSGGVSDFSFIQNTMVFTISLWFKMTSHDDGVTRFIIGNSSGFEKGFRLLYLGGNKSLRFSASTGATATDYNTGSNFITDNNWHHLVFTGNGTNCVVYLDGVKSVLNLISNLSTGDSDNTLTLGTNSASSFYFKGNMDELLILNSNSSDAEVIELYNGGAPFNPEEFSKWDDRELYLHFDDAVWNGSEYSVIDSSGNGRNATTVNMEIEDKVTDVP